MLDYLDWLRKKIPREWLCLLMDQYETSTIEVMTFKAESLGIQLIWIPNWATEK
jgi:hypothetical protein